MTTVLTAANPVSEAINGLLQDATLQTALGGRLFDDIPEDTLRPCGLLEIMSEANIHGLGQGHFPEIEFRVHIFSDIGSLSEAQGLSQQVVNLLIDAKGLVITGFTQAGEIVYHETVTLRDQELNGIKVHEVVAQFTIRAEQ